MYLDICIVIFIIFIIFIYLTYCRKKNIEYFSGISDYSKEYILNDCKINLEPHIIKSSTMSCENNAFVKDSKLLKNLCNTNQNFQVLELDIPNSIQDYGKNFKKNTYLGCLSNQSNVFGLKWNQPSFQNNIKHQLFNAPPLLYNLYFDNNPYVGTWQYNNTIGQINLDGSNFYKIPNNSYIGKWNDIHMNSTNYSISFWMYSTDYTNNMNILQIGESTCQMKINGECGRYPKMTNHNWFNDQNYGGPRPTTINACTNRQSSWTKDCVWRKPAKKLFGIFSIGHSRSNNTSVNMRYYKGEPSINLNSSNINIQTSNANVNYNNSLLNSFINKWYSLNHVLISFGRNYINVFINGELKQSLYANVNASSNSNIYLGAYSSSNIYIKNLIFWNMTFNSRFAHDLYQSYLPIIREDNKIKLMGKKMENNQDSFKTPFKLNKRLYLGTYSDLNFISNNSITVSFTINVKQNYSNWVNIMIINGTNWSWNVRKPGIWLTPNKCALHIRRSTDYSWNEGIDELPFPMNQDVYFKIVYDGSSNSIIVYQNNSKTAKITYNCKGKFDIVNYYDKVWIAANSFGENAYISNFEIEGGVYDP